MFSVVKSRGKWGVSNKYRKQGTFQSMLKNYRMKLKYRKSSEENNTYTGGGTFQKQKEFNNNTKYQEVLFIECSRVIG